MKSVKFGAIALLIVMTISSCQLFKGAKSTRTTGDGHNSALSLDWPGFYTGEINANTRVIVALHQDSSYVLTSKDGAASENVVKKGKFVWRADGNAVTLEGVEKGKDQFLVQENRLALLDAKGKKVAVEGDRQIVLNKDAAMSNLFGKKWVLTMLRGNTIIPNEEGAAFFTMNAPDNRINGYSSCNHFFGQFELKENNRLRFFAIGSTRKACIDMSVEDQLFEVFGLFDGYMLVGNQLQLLKGRMAPLAVFELK